MDSELRRSITPDDFYSIISTSIDGFLLVDLNGNILETNDSYCQMVGYSRDELLKLQIAAVDAIDNKEDVARRIELIIQNGSLRFETQHLHKDGSVIDVEVSTNYYTSHGGSIFSFIRDISLQKLNREILAKQVDFNNRIFNSSDSNLAVIDKNGVVLGVNDAWSSFAKRNLGNDERSWGVGANYFVKYDQELGDTEQTEDVYEGIRKVQSGELTRYSLEYPCHSPDEKRWFLLNVLPLKGNDGSVIVSHTDITARKLTEEALKDSESRWKFALEGAGDGVWDWNIVTSEAFYSLRYKEILGYADNEIGNTSEEWLKRVHPDDITGAMASLQPCLDGRTGSARVEFRMLCKDGSWKWILGRGMVVSRDSDGKPLRMIGTNTDITERKQIEEVQSYLLQMGSLTTGEDFFESLARYLAKILGMDYVCIDRLLGDCLSAKTLAVYHDGKFEDNVEYTLKDTPCGDVVGKEVCVFPREVRNLFPHDAALQDLQAESYVGTTLWSFDMKPIGLIAVIGRKELNSSHFAETVLKLVSIRAAGELGRRQAEEEKHALEQQYQQTQKLESLGVLAGGIAHDFNNILAIIMGYCSLTKMDYENAEKNIPEIEKAAERAAALCKQMLAYAGQVSLSQAKINTRMLVDEMVSMLKTTIQQNVVIKPNLSHDIPAFTGDASQIRQVVMNLIINAAEAIGEVDGEIDVVLTQAEITTKHEEKDHHGVIIPAGRYILIQVTDSGCGMDDNTRRKIFEPFYTTKFTGRGLGMSAVLGIIKGHHGALQLESRLGHGSTFKIYLPVQSSTETEEANQKTASAAWHGSGTILLAEDEEQVKSVAIILLQELGFRVLDAANGKEALELYQQNAADIRLVITDMGMPVMNGYELFYKLKQLNPQLPIIITSGFGEAEIASKVPREEIAGLLNKPYRFEQLRDVLKRGVEGVK